MLVATGSAERWRYLATEARAMAAQTDDPEAKAAMDRLARSYDVLVLLADSENRDNAH